MRRREHTWLLFLLAHTHTHRTAKSEAILLIQPKGAGGEKGESLGKVGGGVAVLAQMVALLRGETVAQEIRSTGWGVAYNESAA